MEIVFIVLTSTLIASAICSAFYIGYRTGKEHKDADGIKLNKATAQALKQYANLYSYDGNER